MSGAQPVDAFSPATVLAEGRRYLDDADFRRQRSSIPCRTRTTAYARERLGAYGLKSHGWMCCRVESALAAVRGRARRRAAGRRGRSLWDGERPRRWKRGLRSGDVFFSYPLRGDRR